MLLLCASSASPVLGLQLTLKWEENLDSGVVGYNIHCGTASGEHSRVIDVGNRSQFTLDGLEDGQDYFFTVTAYDEEGESVDSVEVQYIPAIHNHRPTVEDLSFNVDGNSYFSGMLKSSDMDGNSLEIVIVCPPTQGTLELEDPFSGAFTYIPNPGATGSDMFLYRANDGYQDSNLAVGTVTFFSSSAGLPDDPSCESDAEPDHSWIEHQPPAAVDKDGTEVIGEDGVIRRISVY